MAARPCPISLTGCPGVDAPITNVSAEAPDPLLFAAVVYPTFDPYRPPIIGNGPVVDDDCGSLLTSIFAAFDPVVYAGTQLMADLQAQAIELGCAWPPDGSDVDQNDPTQVYMNDERTATVYCPDGTAFTYTVAAGTVVSPPINASLGVSWQQWANDWAQSYAEAQASLLMDCLDPSSGPVPPGIPDPPPPPGITRPSIPTGPGILPTPGWMCLGEEWFNRYTITGRYSTSYTMSVSGGALPAGVTFTQDGPKTGYVSGTPTTPGQYSFTIQGISTNLPTLAVAVTDYLFVMGISNADTLAPAQVGSPYSDTITGDGGTAPYTFSVDPDSSLPAGFSLSTDGTLDCVSPAAAGTFDFDVIITDANGGECTNTVTLEIVAACVPDSGVTPPVAQPSFISDTLQIDNWATEKLGLVAPTADPAGVQPEWDGTFPVRDLTTVPGWVFYLPTGSAPPAYVALAFNGLLGDTGGILLLQGGGTGPWTLDFNGFVGGVATSIWHGEKAVGSCGAGTYMRTSGLATGPQCFHVGGCPTTLAWWRMDVAPLAEADAVNGLVLTNPGPAPFWASHVAGMYTFALRLHSQGANDSVSTCTNSALSLASSGITIAGWVNNNYNASVVGDNCTLIRYVFYEGATPHFIDISTCEGSNWTLGFDLVTKVTKGWSSGWHFLVATYDPVTGTVGFDVDQAGMTTAAASITAPTVNASSRFILAAQAGAPVSGNADEDFDEFGIFNSVLTTEQLDWLYNSGSGKTYPF